MKYRVGILLLTLILLSSGASLAQETDINPKTLELAFSGVQSNDEWEPYIQEFDGVEMVLVPAGCFIIGAELKESGETNEHISRYQCFEAPFWIDRYEVTNEVYGDVFENCIVASANSSQPYVCVDGYDSQTHCEQRNARLPSETEWEYAARGPDNLIYPWGNEFIPQNVVWYENSGQQTAEVGSRSAGASWVGAMDMSGNVWEWVGTIYDWNDPSDSTDSPRSALCGLHTYESCIIRGGSWTSENPEQLSATFRQPVSLGFWDFSYGFRCARPFEEDLSIPAPTPSG